MEILSINEFENSIIFKNKDDAQVVRLFFHICKNKLEIYADNKWKNYQQTTKLINISRLYVVPGYRRRGWATIIIKMLIQKFPGYTFLINAYPDDKNYMSINELINFYEKFGFKYLRDSEEGVIMIKINI